MTIELKFYYEGALAAESETQRVMREMIRLFDTHTPENKAAFLSMRPTLKKAEEAERSARALYAKVRDDQFKADFQMKRGAFDTLSPDVKYNFMKHGGVLVDR